MNKEFIDFIKRLFKMPKKNGALYFIIESRFYTDDPEVDPLYFMLWDEERKEALHSLRDLGKLFYGLHNDHNHI